MMQAGRTRNINKIGRLAVEQQLEVVINADILDQADSFMPPLGDWIVNRADSDILAHTPSSEMSAGGNLAKPGNRAAQFCSTTHQRRQVSAKRASLATRAAVAAWRCSRNAA